jgi:protein SCO1
MTFRESLRGAAAVLIALAAGGCAAPASSGGAVSPEHAKESLFAHRWTWTDDHGSVVRLTREHGTPIVVTTIYASCMATCPRTVEKLRTVDEAFRRAGRPALFVVVTLDPVSDTPAQLQEFRSARRLPDTWLLLRGSEAQTQALTDLLDVHVLTMEAHIVHEAKIVVFDADGHPRRSFACCDFRDDDAVL